ncbi:hypothetical protein KEM48_004523 [Puccinia striiformis f. sp. tritici PST-130]|nr:hypothetical protein KEM48_004523 [Puccinia striiformis f. sp. tritici PST-130]
MIYRLGSTRASLPAAYEETGPFPRLTKCRLPSQAFTTQNFTTPHPSVVTSWSQFKRANHFLHWRSVRFGHWKLMQPTLTGLREGSGSPICIETSHCGVFRFACYPLPKTITSKPTVNYSHQMTDH